VGENMADHDYEYVLRAAVERLCARATAITGGDDYDQGRRMAYFEALAGIAQAAEDAGMTAADVGMAGFDAGTLVGMRPGK
jgi:hypothetical protein